MAAAGSSGVERKRGAKVTRFTTGELEEFELLMQGIPNFDKRRIKQDAAIATDAISSTGKPANAGSRFACSMISPPRPIHVN